eukprot:comp17167_c0_seq1/m.16021 comp17167_c0_seq1/g.16021  ORF comp17167_c0_seq1/g.16021 comp17167_c0_seq1/m.16021 type:complete len:168 (-) comp17167_c0_seq1:383-886(-)
MLGARNFFLRASQPNRAQRGLYGGKGIQSGHSISFSNKKNPRKWFPNVHSGTYFSDILDREISLRMTSQVIRTIDKMKGFDNYILYTRPDNLASEKGLQLKEEMIETLKKHDCHFLLSSTGQKGVCTTDTGLHMKERAMAILNTARGKTPAVPEVPAATSGEAVSTA